MRAGNRGAETLVGALAMVVLALCLTPWAHVSRAGGWLGGVETETLAALRDAGTQRMIMGGVAAYFFAFWWLKLRMSGTRFCGWRDPNLWLIFTVALAVFHPAANYTGAQQSTLALTLISTATMGQSAATWAAWRQNSRDRRPGSAAAVALAVFAVLLLAACLLGTDTGRTFEYHRRERSSGLWDNPNIYGLLTGVGMVVSLGCLVQTARSEARGFQARSLKGCRGAFYAMAALAMAVGLVNSYSRGAWAGAVLALAYMARSTAKEGERIGPAAALECGRQNWSWLALLVTAVAALMFWQVARAEPVLAKRLASVVDTKDFSWRNRVASWEGALWMMAEKPWVGFGWSQPETVYDRFYRQDKLPESGAIQMNDCLMLGMTLGVPALACVALYVALALATRSPTANYQFRVAVERWPKAACRAATIVLLVGFWFDGGLFKLATAAPFWILLELGRE